MRMTYPCCHFLIRHLQSSVSSALLHQTQTETRIPPAQRSIPLHEENNLHIILPHIDWYLICKASPGAKVELDRGIPTSPGKGFHEAASTPFPHTNTTAPAKPLFSKDLSPI